MGNVFGLQDAVFLGRPRELNVDSSPNCLAVSFTQSSFPYSRLRVTLRRSASSSASVCGGFTGSANCAAEARVPAMLSYTTIRYIMMSRDPVGGE